MNEIELLNARIEKLEQIINYLVKNDRYLFQRDVEFFDGKNIKFGLTTGTKIGQVGTKIGFFGVTPVVKQPTIAAPSGGATIDTQARSAIASLITTLQQLGLSTP